MFSCGIAEDGVETFHIIGAVIGGQGDADEQDADVGCLERGQYGVEIPLCDFEGETTQAVVAAEFDEDHVRMEGDDCVDPGYGVFGGVSTDALIDDVVVVAAGGKKTFEIGGVALVCGVEAVAGGDAVAEADQGLFWGCG